MEETSEHNTNNAHLSRERRASDAQGLNGFGRNDSRVFDLIEEISKPADGPNEVRDRALSDSQGLNGEYKSPICLLPVGCAI